MNLTKSSHREGQTARRRRKGEMGPCLESESRGGGPWGGRGLEGLGVASGEALEGNLRAPVSLGSTPRTW